MPQIDYWPKTRIAAPKKRTHNEIHHGSAEFQFFLPAPDELPGLPVPGRCRRRKIATNRVPNRPICLEDAADRRPPSDASGTNLWRTTDEFLSLRRLITLHSANNVDDHDRRGVLVRSRFLSNLECVADA